VCARSAESTDTCASRRCRGLGALRDFFFKKPLSNGVYSAKNARRDSVIKIQRAEIDGFLCVGWLRAQVVRKSPKNDVIGKSVLPTFATLARQVVDRRSRDFYFYF
jgi:hypothetical protein